MTAVAVLAGYVVSNGETSVFAAVLVPAAVVLIALNERASAALVGLLVLAVMNGLPVVDLSGRLPGRVQVQDVAVMALAVLLYLYRDRSPTARRAPFRRAVRIWSFCFFAWWTFTVARSVLIEGIPWRDAVLFGRDFLYFAILLPLALGARVSPRSLRLGAIVLVGGAVVYALGQTVAGLSGVTLAWLVHPAHDAQIIGQSRFYSYMNYVVDTCLIFAGAALFSKYSPGRRWLVAGVFLILASSAIFGLTRANYFGLVVAVLACAVVYAIRHGSVTTIVVRLTILALVVVAAVTLFSAITGPNADLTNNPIALRVTTGLSDITHSSGTYGYRKQVDESLLQVLGTNWPIGLGFLHPAAHYVSSLPGGSIRNGDTGVFNALTTMGLVGVLLVYAPLALILRELLRVSRSPGATLPRWVLYGGAGWIAWAVAGSATLTVLFSAPGIVVATFALAVLGWAIREAEDPMPTADAASVPSAAQQATLMRSAALTTPEKSRPPARRVPRDAATTVATLPWQRSAIPSSNGDTGPSVHANGKASRSRSSGVPLTAVIVTYNSAHCISKCITALRTVLGDCEVLVVDNLSTDDTIATATATDARVRVISMGRNAGYGSACNSGVAASTNDHVILMNPDVRLERADLDGLRSTFSRVPFGLVALSLRAGVERAAHPQILERSTWWSELGTMALGPFRPRRLPQRADRATLESAAWASGALMLVRRSEFLKVGGFDERFFLYYEDQELGIRYRNAGLPIRGTDVIAAFHGGGQSTADDDQRVASMAWCLLGWLEFVAMQHGQRRANLSATVVRATHRIGRGIVEVGASTSGAPRLRRKAEQLESVDALVTEIALAGLRSEHSSCPAACRAVGGIVKP